MEIKIINNTFNQKIYNQKALHPLQSWQWGEARKKMGIEVLRVGEFNRDQLTNVFQLTIHKIPYINYKIGYLPRSVFPSKPILDFLLDYGKKNHLIFIKIEPYKQIDKKSPIIIKKQNLIKSPHPLFPNWTIILDLNKSEEELFKNMKPKTRYNIRLAQKKGVYIKEESNNQGFEVFSKLYFDTCKRQRYFGHDLNYHRMVFKTLKNSIARILIAYYNNFPLAAYEVFFFNKVIYYPYGGTSIKYRNLMASNLLMWEIIKLGKKLGAEKFDMWGCAPPDYDQNHPWSGFTRFKTGYGGKFVEMIGSYDLVINTVLYKLYNLLYAARTMFLRIKR